MTAPKVRGDRLTQAVRDFFSAHAGIAGPIAVAFSGGADSLALLHAVTKLPPPLAREVTALHVNHRHRPGTADAAHAAMAAAKQLDVTCTVLRPEHKPQRRDENSLRDLRRNLLLTHRRRHKQVLAFAHTADDLVETILLRVVRGTGPGALLAMRDAEQPFDGVIRPLLAVTRADVNAYLAHHQLEALVVDDPTNESPEYARNRMRREILPLLRRENPKFDDALLNLARLAALDDEFIATAVDAAWAAAVHVVRVGRYAQAVEISGAAARFHPAVLTRLVRRAIGELRGGDVSSERVAAALKLIQRDAEGALHSGIVQLGGGMAATRREGKLMLYLSPIRRR